MSAKAFVIRFPNGDFEYDFWNDCAPEVGESVRRRGVVWDVKRIARSTVSTIYVERASTQRSAPPRHAT